MRVRLKVGKKDYFPPRGMLNLMQLMSSMRREHLCDLDELSDQMLKCALHNGRLSEESRTEVLQKFHKARSEEAAKVFTMWEQYAYRRGILPIGLLQESEKLLEEKEAAGELGQEDQKKWKMWY